MNSINIYSYSNNNEKFEYFVASEIALLLGYKNTGQMIKKFVSEQNKIFFKDYKGIKEPILNGRQILINRKGIYDILEKIKKNIPQETIDIFKSIDIHINQDNDDDNLSHVSLDINDGELITYTYISNGIYNEYFIGYQIISLLGYKNITQVLNSNVSKSNQLAFKDYPGAKYPKIDERTILITNDGVVEILLKTRKRISPDVLHLFKKFGIETTNRKCLTKEQQTISHIANVFKTEKIEDQFKVGSYYLDMYFTDYQIVLECDELNHRDRKPGDERDRMDFVNFELNINDTHWIRYNPDEYDFDIMKVIGRVHRKIDEIKAKRYEEKQQEKEREKQQEIEKLKKELENTVKKEDEVEWKLQIEPITGKFTAPPKEILLKMLETKNISQIAKTFAISSNPVSKWLQQYKINIKEHHNYDPPPQEELVEQCKNRSQGEVAKYYNVSEHIIRKWLLGYGLSFQTLKTQENKIKKKELLKAVKETENKKEASEKLNITEKNLEKLVKTHNIERIPDKDELEEILKTMTKEDAAKFLKTTRTTLRKWVRLHDLGHIRFTNNTNKPILAINLCEDTKIEYDSIKKLCDDLKIGKNKVHEYVDTDEEYKGYKFEFINL
jgi:prophage antirepressor-like protein